MPKEMKGTESTKEFLAEERAGDGEIEDLSGVMEDIGTVTKLLDALAQVVRDEYDDDVGAALIAEFRTRFAEHERNQV